MNEELFSRYGRAVFEAELLARKRDDLFNEMKRSSEELSQSLPSESKLQETSLYAKPQEKSYPSHVSPFGPSVIKEFGRGGKYYGAQRRVAKDLGVNQSTVYSVVRGILKSDRIVAALRLVMAKIDKNPSFLFLQPADRIAPLSDQEQKLFRKGQRCHGGIARVAARLGRAPGYVGYVAHGKGPNNEILIALREEIASCIEIPKDTPLTAAELLHFKKGRPCFGILAAISRELGYTRKYASRIACGYRQNPEVMAEIRKRMEVVLKDAAVENLEDYSLTKEELTHFRSGGPCHGIFADISRAHGFVRSYATRVAHGYIQNTSVMAEIRTRMDAAVNAAKKAEAAL